MADTLTPQLSDQQLKQNIDALTAGGAPKDQVQAYVNKYKSNGAGGYILADTNTYQPSLPEQVAGGVGSAIVGAGKAIAQSTAEDFQGLANLPRSIFDPSHPDLAKNIGGTIGAVSDMAIIAAGVLGTPFTGGASDAAAAEGLAVKSAAETGVKAVAQKVASKAAGTVGLSTANAGESFAKAKAAGASDVQAFGAGAVSFGETLATLGLMNKFGPTITNGFNKMIGGTKVAQYAADQFSKAVDTLKTAAQSVSMGDTAEAVKASVNSAATKIGRGVYSLFSKVATSLPEPGENAIGTMADNAFATVNTASKGVDSAYGDITKRLSQFEIPASAAKDIEKAAGDVTQGAFQGAETITEGAQNLAYVLKGGGKVTADTVYGIINQVPPDVKDAVVVDRIQGAIKDALSKTPEGKALWDDMRNLSTQRAVNQEQRTFAQAFANTKGAGWRSAVDSIFGMLKNPEDVGNLTKALGVSMPQFQDMLIKRVMESVSMAYRGVLDSAPHGVVTPEVLTTAQREATAALDKYLGKLPQLPGLLAPEKETLLHSMKNIIPNMETIAKNAGVNMTFEEGKTSLGLAADKQTLDLVQGTDWWKTISSPAKFTEAPAALFRATVPEIQAIKKTLGADSDEWKATGASALGQMLDSVKGLFGDVNSDTVEGVLEKLNARVAGSEEKFTELFDATTQGGKKVSGKDLLDSLVAFANSSAKKGRLRSGFANLAGGLVAQVAHHPFMMINQYKKGIELLTSEEDAFIKDYTSQSKSAITKEISTAMKDGTVPTNLGKFLSIIKRATGTLIRYSARQLLSSPGGANNQTSSDDGSATTSP